MRPDFSQLIRKPEALAAVFTAWQPVRQTETVSIDACFGRVLAADLYSKVNLPVVRASTMDGIALRSADFADGARPDTRGFVLGRDYCRADTGDDFDDAFDTVAAIEEVTLLPEGGFVFNDSDFTVEPGMNLKGCGSNLKIGEQVGTAGTLLTPSDAAVIAMGGYDTVEVIKKPLVSFLPTGSELVPVGTPLERGQNYDTNSLLIKGMLAELGAECRLHPIVRDDPDAIGAALDALLTESDIVLLGAGTSKGEEDYTFRTIAARGNVLFHGAAAVPGRPMSVTMAGNTPIVNLSGPAFAAFHGMEWLVGPMVAYALGVPALQREHVTATLTRPMGTPPFFSMLGAVNVERMADGTYLATPAGGRGPKGSGIAKTMTANAIYPSVPGEKPHETGTEITVQLVRNPGLIPESTRTEKPAPDPAASLPDELTPEIVATLKNCPCCPNHCPKDALQCGRGKALFGGDMNAWRGGGPHGGPHGGHNGHGGPHGAHGHGNFGHSG